MQLPPQLHHAIEQETARCNMQALARAATELSENYRTQRSAFLASEIQRLAYIAARLPATFAATYSVFAEIRRLMPDPEIHSLLDLGAGPGTAGWAATETFGELRQITLIERDEGLIHMGKSLARAGENAALENADWMQADLHAAKSFPEHDLVVSSYAFGEIGQNISHKILKAAWSATRTALVIVEPGTMIGFDLIRRLRDELIGLGAHLIAPCPHQRECPIPADDWCHFSQRLGRSSLHRRLKIGTLGYEDEKFSYIAASKHPIQPASARVIRHPMRHSGHTRIQLCAKDGIQTTTVTRSDKKNWKRARKTNWGDAWP